MSTEMIPSDSGQVPAFLQTDDVGDTLALLAQYTQPPRMKLRQPTARSPLREAAAEGSVVLMPSMQIVASKDEVFHVVPVFFYPEWCVFNPLNMPDLPTIRERTLDPQSEIAARSRSAETRTAPVPGFENDFNNPDQKKVKRLSYREHLNFIFELQDGPLVGTQFVATFAKSEHKTGRMLASSIQMRSKTARCKPYGLVFAAKSSERSNKDGVWFGLDLFLPTEHSAFVETKEHYDLLESSFEDLLKAYTNSKSGKGDFINAEDEEAQPSAESSEF